MKMSGPPCKNMLKVHQDIDLLHSYIKPISGFGDLRAIPLKNLASKSVLIKSADSMYIVTLPNSFELH